VPVVPRPSVAFPEDPTVILLPVLMIKEVGATVVAVFSNMKLLVPIPASVIAVALPFWVNVKALPPVCDKEIVPAVRTTELPVVEAVERVVPLRLKVPVPVVPRPRVRLVVLAPIAMVLPVLILNEVGAVVVLVFSNVKPLPIPVSVICFEMAVCFNVMALPPVSDKTIVPAVSTVAIPAEIV
jgi:hypothetical protein